ncbi:MAG TPA: glycosyl hydrolase family 79 C-terminal domain-containing protein [Solirubrobacteraceae bacterium]|nr:glycosyl hydrolase family 79 C-terminal domain-containing protein [Solirubrobacteraceae bacterium]
MALLLAGAGLGAAIAAATVPHAAPVPPGRTVTVSAEQARALPDETVAVGRVPHGRRRPAGFLSMSLQYRTVGQWGRSVSPVLVRLVDQLDPVGGEILRLGGQGGDRVWWPVPHVHRPGGVSDTLSPAWIRAARRLATALRARYALQVNLEANSELIARVEADHLYRGLGRSRIAAWEIGNEPELYRTIPWYWKLDGRALPWYADRGTPLYARGPGYGPAQFLAQWQAWERLLPGGIPLAGPDFVFTTWLSSFAGELSRHSRLRTFDVHAYPVIKCVTNPASFKYPSIPHLLALGASRNLLAGVRGYIGRAHAVGARFVLDEVGPDSCGGNAGISNSMAAALWAIDMLFEMDRAGVDAVDLHSLPGTVNALFDVSRRHGRWRARVLPFYLGSLVFAEAAPPGSRLLWTSDPDEAALRSWATLGGAGVVRVALVNDGGPRVVTVRPRTRGAATAQLEVLRAPGAGATHGFVLAGRHEGTTDTGDVGPLRDELVARRHGAYRFVMRGASAAVLTLSAPATTAR